MAGGTSAGKRAKAPSAAASRSNAQACTECFATLHISAGFVTRLRPTPGSTPPLSMLTYGEKCNPNSNAMARVVVRCAKSVRRLAQRAAALHSLRLRYVPVAQQA